jgi:hypothetical protein
MATYQKTLFFRVNAVGISSLATEIPLYLYLTIVERGSVVVKTLFHKPEGRGFQTEFFKFTESTEAGEKFCQFEIWTINRPQS